MSGGRGVPYDSPETTPLRVLRMRQCGVAVQTDSRGAVKSQLASVRGLAVFLDFGTYSAKSPVRHIPTSPAPAWTAKMCSLSCLRRAADSFLTNPTKTAATAPKIAALQTGTCAGVRKQSVRSDHNQILCVEGRRVNSRIRSQG